MDDYLTRINDLRNKKDNLTEVYKKMIDDLNDLIDKLDEKKNAILTNNELDDLNGVINALDDFKYQVFGHFLEFNDIACDLNKPFIPKQALAVYEKIFDIVEQIKNTDYKKLESLKILASMGFNV